MGDAVIVLYVNHVRLWYIIPQIKWIKLIDNRICIVWGIFWISIGIVFTWNESMGFCSIYTEDLFNLIGRHRCTVISEWRYDEYKRTRDPQHFLFLNLGLWVPTRYKSMNSNPNQSIWYSSTIGNLRLIGGIIFRHLPHIPHFATVDYITTSICHHYYAIIIPRELLINRLVLNSFL